MRTRLAGIIVLLIAAVAIAAAQGGYITADILKVSKIQDLSGKNVVDVSSKNFSMDKLVSPSIAWNFSAGDKPVSAATVIVSKEDDGYTYARWWNGTVLYKSNDGHDDDDIQAAVDAVAAIGGGKVSIGEGDYYISNTVTLKSFVEIEMTPNTIIVPDGATTVFLGEYGSSKITVKGGYIGYKATSSGDAPVQYDAVGIDLQFSHEALIEDVTFASLKRGALILETAWDARITKCSFFNCGDGSAGYPAVLLKQDPTRGDNTNSVKFIGCRFESHVYFATQLEIATPSRQNFFDTCKFHGDAANTYPLVYIHGDSWNRNQFVNCIFEWNGAPLVKIEDATANPTIFGSCVFQSWGYYDTGEPYIDLVYISNGRAKFDGCQFIGGNRSIYAEENANGYSIVWINGAYMNYPKSTACELVNSDIRGGTIYIANCGQHAIVIDPKYHSTIENVYIVNSDLDGLNTPAIWVKGAGLKILSDVYITLTSVGYQFDATPQIVKNVNIDGKKFENSGKLTGIAINNTANVLQKFWVAHGLAQAPTRVQLTLTEPTANDFAATVWWAPNSTDPNTYFDVYVMVTKDSLTAGATVNCTWTAWVE